MSPGAAAADEVVRLTGVYHAEGSLLGELRYLVGRTLGRTHCALCDITHGSVRIKPAWVAARSRLPVPFDAVHLDERSPELEAVTAGRTPCVVAHTGTGLDVILGPANLAACEGEPEALVDAIIGAVDRRGWSYLIS